MRPGGLLGYTSRACAAGSVPQYTARIRGSLEHCTQGGLSKPNILPVCLTVVNPYDLDINLPLGKSLPNRILRVS